MGEALSGEPRYDVVLMPTYAQAVGYRRRVAAQPGGERALFGVAVTTFSSWVADLWELYGDGRALVSPVERALAMDVVCAELEESTRIPGLAAAAVRCVRSGAGLPAFEDACAQVRAGERPAGCNDAEIALLSASARYRAALAELNRVEEGEALALLGDAMPDRPLRVLLHELSPLTAQQERFLAAHPSFDVVRLDAPGGEGVERAPEGVALRFAFPSGPTAWPKLLCDIVGELGGQASSDTAEELDEQAPSTVVVACKDPLVLYERVADALRHNGYSCAVRARRPFALTDFGRAFFALQRFLAADEDAWRVADATDFLLSPFSGTSTGFAYDFDAQARGNRLVSREALREQMRGRVSNFERWEDLVSDPEASIVAGVIEDSIRRMAHRPEAWRREQLGAIAVLREVANAARLVGAGMAACVRQLERATVDASRQVAARVAAPTVLITDNSIAARLADGCTALIVADLTSADHPIADPDDAVSLLLERLGANPRESALSRARRKFCQLVCAPRAALVLERSLNDAAAEPTYPAAVLEEFVDCYRDDPAATDDIDNPYALPPQLRTDPEPYTNGEEHLLANATLSARPQERAARIARPSLGEATPAARPLVVLPRSLGAGRCERNVLSPSQIESYLECPYKWFAQRRLRLDSLDEEFGPLSMGSFAHAALKSFYTHFQEETGLLKVTPESLPQARTIMREVIDRHREEQFELKVGTGRLVPISQLERREVDALAEKLVRYLDYEAQLLPTFHPAYLEYELDLGNPVPYAGCSIIGTVDRVDVDDKGNAVVIDYKGSLGKGYARADGEGDEGLGKVQALVYAQALRRTLGLNVVGTLYVCYGKNPRAAGTYDGRVLDAPHLPNVKHEDCAWMPAHGEPFSAYLDEVEQRVEAGLAGLFAGDAAPCPAADRVCRWCPVASCPERRE